MSSVVIEYATMVINHNILWYDVIVDGQDGRPHSISLHCEVFFVTLEALARTRLFTRSLFCDTFIESVYTFIKYISRTHTHTHTLEDYLERV